MPYAGVNGTRLYYEIGGEGDMVVLLHGYLADADSMEAPATGLSTGLRAIRIDRRGHGRSNPVEAPPPLAVEAADVAALLDWFSVDKAHFLTHDTGSEVAIEFALTYPERTRSMCLLSPVADGFNWSPEETARQADLRSALKTDVKKALESWKASPLFEMSTERDGLVDRVQSLFSRVSGGITAFERAPVTPTQGQRLASVTTKTGVFIGERDEPERIRCAQAIAGRIPGAELTVFPGLGRFLHVEDARAVMRRLTDFFIQD